MRAMVCLTDLVYLALGYWNISLRMIVTSPNCEQNVKKKNLKIARKTWEETNEKCVEAAINYYYDNIL